MNRGTPTFSDVTAVEELHVSGKYRDRSLQHTCSRQAAWDPHNSPSYTQELSLHDTFATREASLSISVTTCSARFHSAAPRLSWFCGKPINPIHNKEKGAQMAPLRFGVGPLNR